jgi:Flp pilus assembly protein TadG
MRLKKWSQWLQRRQGDERGAEMVEFAVIVVLLITIVYGIAAFGLIFGANETVTQAAADASRAGMVFSSATYGVPQAQTTALNDMGWLVGSSATCATATVDCLSASGAACPTAKTICVNAYQNSGGTTFTTVVTYNYAQHPLLYAAPGLSVITPSTLVSSATYQVTATAS